MRRGAVRSAGKRAAWQARANTAMSMQAVLPAAVGMASASGQQASPTTGCGDPLGEPGLPGEGLVAMESLEEVAEHLRCQAAHSAALPSQRTGRHMPYPR